jgi:hypothetical protein
MAEAAFQEKFRQEVIMGFEGSMSYARKTVTIETEIEGLQATFLVADSGGAEAVTRGINGDIPTRPDNLNQFTATLVEWHDVPERTRFNIYTSQGDGKRIMQKTSMKVMNRKIDKDIHVELETGTETWGAAAVVTLPLITKAIVKLGNNFALEDEEPYALITPAFRGQLMGLKEFASADYINTKPFEGSSKSIAFNWYGVNWIVDAKLPGTGTDAAKCYMYARAAMGHACDTESVVTRVGYDDKNDKSWARCTTFMASKRLQNSGIIKMPHLEAALST